jgi:6-phosphogluconolactonase
LISYLRFLRKSAAEVFSMAIIVFDHPKEVAHAAAERFFSTAQDSIKSAGRFSVALSGGSTPKQVNQLIAENFHNTLDWSSIHIFFGDERCVPWDHPDSNYRMARETLLSRVPTLTQNVHPLRGDGDPTVNAREYQQELRAFFIELEWPRFDLIFLGLGEDGHTASLFPKTSALNEKRAWVVANWVEKLNSYRLTLTASAINHAKQILFLVTGSSKAKALSAIVNGPVNTDELPAQLIHPVEGSCDWLVDREAASQLDR